MSSLSVPVSPAANRLRSTIAPERPQERLETFGPTALSDTELLAMILRNGTAGHDVLSLAAQLMAEAGSLAQLVRWREAEFRRFRGIGRVKALQLMTVMEVARRTMAEQTRDSLLFDQPETVHHYFRAFALGLQVEKFWVLCLNRKNRLLRQVEITSGTAANTLVHPREVFREAIREGATAIIAVHNHPSGDTTPSVADIQATRQLREASKTIDIELLDHVIISSALASLENSRYYSFREAGLL